MSTTASIANITALANCDAAVDAVDTGGAGKIRIYSGTVPTDVDTAISAQVTLVDITLSNPAFGAAADLAPGARATLDIDPALSGNPINAGTASFARFINGAGTAKIQCTVGTSGEGINLNTVTIAVGIPVTITAFTYTVPES